MWDGLEGGNERKLWGADWGCEDVNGLRFRWCLSSESLVFIKLEMWRVTARAERTHALRAIPAAKEVIQFLNSRKGLS
jgi:hypothetical protein